MLTIKGALLLVAVLPPVIALLVGLLPCYLLLFIHYPSYRAVMDFGSFVFYTFWGFCIEKITGTRLVIHGDKLPRDAKRVLLLSNHRTRTDGVLMFAVAARAFPMHAYRVMLKAAIKYVPYMGWGGQLSNFMYLSRKWEMDKPWFINMLRQYRQRRPDYSLLVFPEGSDYEGKAIQSDREYATKNGLPQYTHVLHPRVTGTYHVVDELKDSLNEVYNVTIAYKGAIPQFETALFTGKVPEEVHVYIQRIPAKKFPKDRPGIEKWLNDEFTRKNEILSRFYGSENYSFDNIIEEDRQRRAAADKENEQFWEGRRLECFDNPGYDMKRVLFCAFFLYTMLLFIGYVAYLFPLLFWPWFVVFHIGFFMLTRRGGAEKLELRMHPPRDAVPVH